ncbi:hypothetical protein [Nocardia sp. CA-135398]|uniref:hypothetical protein n=1 Tax=Nocardia sp. CA-135398 TaxID=3239977 RepID=UPI003D9803D5
MVLDDWQESREAAVIPVKTPFLLSPRFDYDVALNGFFLSADMIGLAWNTQDDYARDVKAFLNFLWHRKRRHALQDWSIDIDTWEQLSSKLPPTPGPVQPVLDDRKRRVASIYVWTRGTNGEHHDAPRPIQAQQPLITQQRWASQITTIYARIIRADPHQHYVDLRKLLDPIADRIAHRIDARDCSALLK